MVRWFFLSWFFLVGFAGCAAQLAPDGKPPAAPLATVASPTAIAAFPTAPLPSPSPVSFATVIPPASASCSVTPLVRADAPPDHNADPVRNATWAMNADRTIWASVPLNGYRFEGGDKSYWVRPAGEQLTVSGHRLDAMAEPLNASVPCCYPTSFQIVGLDFPTKGCWVIEGKTENHELLYVTEVR